MFDTVLSIEDQKVQYDGGAQSLTSQWRTETLALVCLICDQASMCRSCTAKHYHHTHGDCLFFKSQMHLLGVIAQRGASQERG